jgi:hypothetical protein
MSKFDSLFQDNYLRLSRPLIHKFGLAEAVLLSEVYSEHQYWLQQKRLSQGGWFFSTIENLQKNTGLTRHQQLSAVKTLSDYGIIQVKYTGMPKKRFFRLNPEMFDQLEQDLADLTKTQATEEDEFANAPGFDSDYGFVPSF